MILIRFCLGNPKIFKTQLRAILRASASGNVKLMYPMISGLHELRRANEYLAEVKVELSDEGHAFDANIDVGAMIEIPSAAMIIDLLAPEVDFFSIGTNDLIQYLMAADRLNDQVAHLYEPAHPAVLRTLKAIIGETMIAGEAGFRSGACHDRPAPPVERLGSSLFAAPRRRQKPRCKKNGAKKHGALV